MTRQRSTVTTTLMLLALAIVPGVAGCSSDSLIFCQLTAILNGLDPESEDVIADCFESLETNSLGGYEAPSDEFEFDCADGQDGDNDGLIDCDDPDCANDAACDPAGDTPGVETDCNNDFDDDFDGLEDCCDPDCANAQICEFFNGVLLPKSYWARGPTCPESAEVA